MDKSKIKVLVVDDEQGLCTGIQEALKREGYQVDAANEAATALQMIGDSLYNLVLTDVKMPGMSGLQFLTEGREKSRDTLFILMTAYGTVESAVTAMKSGAYDYLSKPIDMQRLRALVLKALEFQAVVAENNELRARLKKRSEPSLLIGNSEALRQVTRLAGEVARSDVTVLLEGETGTGKELLARSLHLSSDRVDKPFISVNCAALPEQLLERVVLTSQQAVVAPEDLPDFLRAADQTASRFTIRPGMSLAEVEKLVIRQTLTHVTDNRDQAAKLLGISRRSLQYKLKEYGLLD
jgi:DNA-binding NtrC family response regulator